MNELEVIQFMANTAEALKTISEILTDLSERVFELEESR